jgi:hypothetical protein
MTDKETGDGGREILAIHKGMSYYDREARGLVFFDGPICGVPRELTSRFLHARPARIRKTYRGVTCKRCLSIMRSERVKEIPS